MRSKTMETGPLKRDEIAQMFLYLEAQHPKRPKEQIVGGICDYFGVGRSYVYQVVKEIDPERKKNIGGRCRGHREILRA